MSPTRRFRWLSMFALVALLLLACASASASAASSWGELARFGGVDKAKRGHKFLLEEAHAFGVDSTDNSVYVGDDRNELEENNEFRLQKYTESGEFVAEAIVNKGELLPAGMEKIEEVEGVAVDPTLKRLYVLVTYLRNGTDTVTPGVTVAGAVYAFSTVPAGNKLVPAEGTKGKGIFTNVKELNGDSEEVGKALLEPAGLTVSPTTHQVMILGQVENAKSERHVALARISSAGAVEPTYEDPTPLAEEAALPNSPVTSGSGHVYFQEENQILQVPGNFSGPPKTVFAFAENLTKGPFHEELLNFGGLETFFGGALAIQNEGSNAGTFTAFGEAGEMNEAGKPSQLVNVALGVKFTEEGEAVKTSELGWTGGVSSEEPKTCALEFGGRGYTQVAMGKGTAMFALTSGRKGEVEQSEVVKFGPEGSGCPSARAIGGNEPIEATVNGEKVKPETSTPVTLSVKVQGANVLSTKWSFGDGSPEATEATVTGQQTQSAEVKHKFAKAGSIKVEATILTDDLATPEIKVAKTFEVLGLVEGAPKVTKEPVDRAVAAGETATFEAAASGEPQPSVQWEESTDVGKSWHAMIAATANKLELVEAKESQTKNEYRATFKNSKGEKLTRAATLTVLAPKAPEVTRNPSSASVTEGETAAFEASGVGTPEPKVQWEASSNGGASWSTVAGAESGRLLVPGTKVAQSGSSYRARFTNKSGSAASAPATLTVSAKPPLPPPPPPPSGGGSGGGGLGVLPIKEEHPIPQPVATLAGASLSVTATGMLVVKISCPAGESVCSGTVTLRTLTAVSARARSAKSKKAILTLASGSFAVSGGSVKAVTLHLTPKARKLLGRMRKLRARATVLAHDPAGASNTALSTVTLALAKGKRKH
jgi:immunoglobulin I-set domain protein/PKD domain-containing protein